MDIYDFESIHPFVRMVKIKKSLKLEGGWEDLDHVMIYIARGSVTYNVLDIPYTLNVGDIILMPPYLYHCIFTPCTDNLVQYILHFDLFTTPTRRLIPHQSAKNMLHRPDLPEEENLFRNTVYTASIPSEERFQFENLFLQMYREFSQQHPGYESMLCGMALQTIFSFLRYVPQEKMMTDTSGQKSKPWKLVQNALEYIWLHYSENLENSTIANAINVSPNYLTKIFRQHIGTSLHKYVTSYRLEQAQQMLVSGRYNVTEVAQKCGFSSIHMFSKLFKQECGISPSSYVVLPHEEEADLPCDPDYNLHKQTFYNL